MTPAPAAGAAGRGDEAATAEGKAKTGLSKRMNTHLGLWAFRGVGGDKYDTGAKPFIGCKAVMLRRPRKILLRTFSPMTTMELRYSQSALAGRRLLLFTWRIKN